MAKEENGKLKEQLIERDKVILILKVRSRIKKLEKKFLGQQDRNDTRRKQWRKILCSITRFYLNNVEFNQFRAMITINYNVFINTVCDLYGDFIDVAAHKVLFPVQYDRNYILQMFNDLGMIPDDAKISSVEAILTPIPLS